TFIRTGALAAAGAMILPKTLSSLPPKAKGIVGLQLYSVRADMSKDPSGSLKQVSVMGYVYVEHANYVNGKFYGYEPKDFRKVLDDLGLKMISGHTALNPNHWDNSKKDFADSWKKLVEDAAILGQQYVVSPAMNQAQYRTYDDLMKTMEIFNKAGELCKKYKMKFGYHNHDFEFKVEFNGEKMFDIIMKTIDPKMVIIQLDIGNLYNGGARAIDVVKKYPGRWENIHVKDEIQTESGRYESCIVGEGIVNIREVLDLAKKIGGTKVFIIEQEAYQSKTPMECVKADLEIMRKWGY
ncbi:MAG: sugar phosphate isomerase/epimerase family protein, partial [Bacteroidales bacterium]